MRDIQQRIAGLLKEHWAVGSRDEWSCACGSDFHNQEFRQTFHEDHLAEVLVSELNLVVQQIGTFGGIPVLTWEDK